MNRIFESAGTILCNPAPEFAAWIAAQVAMIATHCEPHERPNLRTYRLGHEYLACDYPSLALTIRIDPDAKMPGCEALDQNIAVPDMTDALTLISLIERARQGTWDPSISLGTYLPGSCVQQQPPAKRMTERTVTMDAIRMLAQTSEALCSPMSNAVTIKPFILAVAARCSDHVEHLAQYDVEDLDLQTRMRSLVDSLTWLRKVQLDCQETLQNTLQHVPDAAQIDSLISCVWQLCLTNPPAARSQEIQPFVMKI